MIKKETMKSNFLDFYFKISIHIAKKLKFKPEK